MVDPTRAYGNTAEAQTCEVVVMNIGIDGRLWNETGVGRHLRALVDYLEKMVASHDFWLFLQKKEFSTFKPPSKKWRAILADVSWHTVEEQLKMPFIYRQAPLDLLHIPYFSVPILTTVPYVVTIHDLILSHYATGKATTKSLPIYIVKQLGYRMVVRSAVARARHILTVSHTVRNQLLEEFKLPPQKVSVTYEAGGLEGNSSGKLPPQKSPYLLYVGNAHPHKNLLRLVDAYQQVRQKFPQLTLVLIGRDDFFYKRLESEVRVLRKNTGVVFKGEIPNRDLWTWYENAEAFIFPSLAEGFGIPGVEAMSVGCPLIVSDITVFHEVYGEAAIYFNPTDSNVIAHTIIRLLQDKPLQKRLKTLGQRRAQRYSWKRMTEETLAIYENCLGLRSHQ